MDSFVFCDYDCSISGCYRQVAEVKDESIFISINSGNINDVDVQYIDIESLETCDTEPEPEPSLLVLDEVTQTQTQTQSLTLTTETNIPDFEFDKLFSSTSTSSSSSSSVTANENENPLNKRKMYNCSVVFDQEGGCNCYCYSSADFIKHRFILHFDF